MNQLIKSVLVGGIALAGLVLVAPSTVMAEAEVNVTLGATETGKPLAVRGYDVVAYFTDGKPTIGLAKFAAVYDDATYYFASQDHLTAFKADPDKFVPQFGGYCAYGCFVGRKFDGDPLVWKIVDGKLYLNLNPAIQVKWSEDTPGKIAAAEQNWKRIEHLAPGDIK